MDSVLKELKEHREEAEQQFWQALEESEQHQHRLAELIDSLEVGSQSSLGTEHAAELLRSTHATLARMSAAMRNAFSLHNARTAELARQLTVLPLERMDLVMDAFERRLENLEVRLQRLEPDGNS